MAYAILVFYLSSLPAGDLPPEIHAFPHADKVFHAAEYFVLGGFVLLAFVKLGGEGLEENSRLLSVLVGGIYAVTDEFHQTFVPGRSGSVEDVLADMLGVALAVAVGWPLLRGSLERTPSADPPGKD